MKLIVGVIVVAIMKFLRRFSCDGNICMQTKGYKWPAEKWEQNDKESK